MLLTQVSRLRNAPSVSFPVGRSRFQGRCLLLLWVLAVCATVAWFWQAAYSWTVLISATLLLLGCGGFAWFAWRHSPVGVLHWRDGLWSFGPVQGSIDEAGALQSVEVSLDLQNVLLLCLKEHNRPVVSWIWLSRHDAPACWNALRRAAYARTAADPVDDKTAIGLVRGA